MEQKRLFLEQVGPKTVALGVAAALSVTASAEAAPNMNIQPFNAVVPQEIGRVASRCGLRYVQPNKQFTRHNSGLSKQVDLVDDLYRSHKKITISDIATATRIIYYSNQDPRYASAMQRTRNQAANDKTVTARTFLATKPANPKPCGDRNHISESASRTQIEQTTATGQDLVRRVGRGIGRQASRFVKVAYDRFTESVDRLIDQRP